MASNGGQIRFGVGFDVDQSSLSKIKSSLREIQNLTTKDIQLIDASKTEQDLKEIKKSASELQAVLQKSFNSDLGTLNVTKFNEALKKMDLDLNKIQRDFASAGAVGQKAFKDITTQVLTTNMQLTRSKTIVDQMGTTMMNTVKWGVASSIMNSFTGSVQEAFGFVKSLDKSLTDIRIVTGQSRDEMAQFAVEANNAATALGRQTKEYTQAALTFYQQGLGDQEVKSRTETTLKASNITGQNSAQMADELTAVWNGFQVQVGQEADVVSKLAAVADSSASNMSELATAMSKVAAVANSMGVDIDQLNAQIATIVSVTRSAPESVGNALKTIYARIADIKAGIDEEETSLGNYSSKIAALGFNILDANGDLKDMGEFLEEVGNGWANLSREQQVYLARTMAGQRQYNNLVTLFDNWDKYIKNVNTSLNSQGTLEEKNSRYMESLAAHIKEFEAAKEGLMISATDTESFKDLVDIFTDLTKGLTNFVDALGGGGNALMSFGAIATTVFSKQIGGAIGDLIVNFQNVQNDFATIAARKDFNTKLQGNDNVYVRELAELNGRALNVVHLLTDEQQKQLDQLIQQTNELQNQEIDWKEKVKLATEYYNEVSKSSNENAQNLDANNLIKLDKDSQDYKDIVANLDAVKLHIEETNGDLQKYKTSILDAQKAVNRMIKTQQTASIESKEYTVATQNAQKALGGLEVTTESVIATSKQLYEEKILEEEQYNELSSAYLSFKELVDTEAPEEKQIEAANRFFDLFKRRIEEAKNQVYEVGETLTAEVEGASETLRNTTVDFKGSIIKALKPAEIQNMTTQVVKLAGGIGSISMACINLARIPKIWDDENLTKAEKLTQIIQTISFNLPMFATGVTQIGGAIKSLGSIIALAGTTMTAEAAATARLTAETIGLGTAFSTVLAAIGPVVAILGVLGIAVYGVYQYLTRFERAVDDANQQLKKQQELLEKVKQEQSELTNYIDKYEELSDKIKSITRYTDEWRGVNDELNQSVSELIAKFPELTKYVTTIEGHIGLTKQGIEAAKQANELAIQSATLGQLTSQKQLLQAQQKLSLNNIVNKIGSLDYNTNGTGALYNDIGAVNARVHLNALDGEGNHVSISIDEAKELQAALEALKDSNEEVWYNDVLLKETLIKNENISAQIADKLVEHKDALQQLQITTNNNLEALNNLNNTITETYLQRSDKFQGDENAIYRELIAQSTGQDQTNYVKDYWNLQAESNADTIGNFEDVIEDFLQTETGKQYAGIEYQLDKEHSQGWAFTAEQADKNTKYLFGDVSISIKEMKDAIQTAGQYNNAIEKAEKHHFDEAVKAFEKMDQNIAASMLHGLQEGSTLDYTQYTKEQQEAFEEGLYSGAFSDEKLKDYGINIATGFKEGVKDTRLEDAKAKDLEARDSIYNQSESSAEYQLLSDLGQSKDINTQQLGEIQKNFHQISLGSEETNKSVIKLFSTFGVEGQKAVEVSKILTDASMHLNEDDAWNKFSNTFKELGINIPTSALKEFVDELGYTEVWQEKFLQSQANINEVIASFNTKTKMSKKEMESLQESFEIVMGTSQDMVALYPHLADDVRNAFDPELNGTSKQLIALQALQEQMENLDIEKITQELYTIIQEGNDFIQQYAPGIDKELSKIEDKFLDKDLELHAKIIADLDTDTDIEGQVRGWMDSVNKVIKDGAKAGSEEWSNAFDALYANSEAFAEKAHTSILSSFETLKDGTIQFKDEYIPIIQEVLQAELDTAMQGTEGVIQAEQQKLEAKAAGARAQAQASKDYAAALEKQLNLSNTATDQEKQNAVDAVNKKKEAWEKEGQNFENLAKEEMDGYNEIAEGSAQSANDQNTAANNTAATAKEAGDSVATTWSNTAESVSNSAAVMVDALNKISLAQKNAKEGNGEIVSYQGGVSGGSKNTGVNNVIARTSQVTGPIEAHTKAAEMQEALDNVGDSAEKRAEAQRELIAALNAEADAADAYADKVEGLGKKLFDNQSKQNAAKTGGSDKGKGGGGKGKSAKEKTEKEPDKMEPFEDNDLDSIQGKFHDIDLEIQRLTKDLEKLQKLQNRYLGSALVHNLNEQLKIAKKQKAAYGEKLKIAKEELEAQKKKLEAQGIEIGKDGNIKNYTEALKQKQKEVNALVDKYNSATKEGQENLKGQVEAQKKNYNELKNQMNAYEQLNGQTIPEIEAQIAQIEEMIIELQIEKFNAKIELHLDWQSFLQDYKDFQNSTKEFFNSRATMYVDLETGETSGHNDNYENALEAGKAKAENARIARQQAAAAEEAYQTEMKNSKKKKYKNDLAEKYGIDTEDKSNKQIKKELQKAIADAYEARNNAIKEQKEKADAEIDRNFKDGFNISSDEQAEALNEYRDRINEINQTALEERTQAQKDLEDNQKKFKDNQKDIKNSAKEGAQKTDAQKDLEDFYGVNLTDKDEFKKFKNTMVVGYQDALKEIEEARKESLDEAEADYNNAISNITDSGKVKIVDVFKTYTSKMDELAEASDQMINGTLLANGSRGKSIIEESMEHAEELAERIQRMNDNTKYDKQGNKIMGTDDLKVGTVNPLTGEKIKNKKELKQVKKQIGKDKSSQVYADMQKKIYEDGKKYAQSLQDQITTLQQQIQQAWENYYAAIDKVLEYTKEIIDDYEYINDMYDMQLKYLKLIGEEDSDRVKDIKEKQKANQDAQNEYYKQQIVEAKKGLQKAKENHGIESEEYKKYYEQLKSLSKDYYESRLKQIEDLRDEAIKANEDIIETLNKNVTNQLGIQETSERWNNTKTEADSYLNSLEKVNALQSLRAKYQEAIDSTDDIKQQEELRRIMEEQLGALQQADYLSEKEVTNAENLLDVTKKQMALEEAKQNKSKMRLRRDSQGNYTYQFVADENNIKNKQQELQDSLKKMNDDTTKALRENYDEQTRLFDEFQQKLKEISDKYLSGESGWSQEQYAERINYTTDQYEKQKKIYEAQQNRMETNYTNSNVLSMVGAAANAGGLANESDLKQFMADTGISAEEAQVIREILQSLGSEDGEYSILKLLGNTNLQEIMDQMSQGSYDTISNIGGTNELLGTVEGDLLNNHKEAMQQVEDARDKLLKQGIDNKDAIDKETTQLTEEMIKDTSDTIDKVGEHKDAITGSQEDGNSKLDDLYDQASALEEQNLEAIGGLQATLDNLLATLQNMAEESEMGSGTGTIGKNKLATIGHMEDGVMKQDTNVTWEAFRKTGNGGDWAKIHNLSIEKVQEYNDALNWINSGTGRVQILSKKANKNGYVHVQTTLENGKTVDLGWIKADQLVGYDTGGYTGDWSNTNGKLAMLHKKELVLNQTDTSNILDAVQVARSIADAVSSLGIGAVSNLGAAVSSVLGDLTGSSSTVDQNVTIQANFPNVNSHTEIETALMNLVNVASQKATPNKRAY